MIAPILLLFCANLGVEPNDNQLADDPCADTRSLQRWGRESYHFSGAAAYSEGNGLRDSEHILILNELPDKIITGRSGPRPRSSRPWEIASAWRRAAAKDSSRQPRAPAASSRSARNVRPGAASAQWRI